MKCCSHIWKALCWSLMPKISHSEWCFVLFLSLTMKIMEYDLKLVHECWIPHALQFITQWYNHYLPYTECPRRSVPDFRRVFLMLKYTDITQNTYSQSWTVTEIMAREKWGLLAVPNTATCTADMSRDNASSLERGMQCSLCLRDALCSQPCYVTAGLSHV